jgi:DNA-damage-inducible protein J
MKTATIRARVEPGLKAKAEKVLEGVGLSPTDAITIFYRQVVLHRGLPFPVRIPNKVTRRTMARTDAGEDLHRYGTAEDMFEDLEL